MFGQILVMRLFRNGGVLTQICGNDFMVLKVAPLWWSLGPDRYIRLGGAAMWWTGAPSRIVWSEALAWREGHQRLTSRDNSNGEFNRRFRHRRWAGWF